MQGDSPASKVCRRLLDSMARVQGINTSVAQRLAPSRISDVDDFDDIDDDGVDELEACRHRRTVAEAGGTEAMDGAYRTDDHDQRDEPDDHFGFRDDDRQRNVATAAPRPTEEARPRKR